MLLDVLLVLEPEDNKRKTRDALAPTSAHNLSSYLVVASSRYGLGQLVLKNFDSYFDVTLDVHVYTLLKRGRSPVSYNSQLLPVQANC